MQNFCLYTRSKRSKDSLGVGGSVWAYFYKNKHRMSESSCCCHLIDRWPVIRDNLSTCTAGVFNIFKFQSNRYSRTCIRQQYLPKWIFLARGKCKFLKPPTVGVFSSNSTSWKSDSCPPSSASLFHVWGSHIGERTSRGRARGQALRRTKITMSRTIAQ